MHFAGYISEGLEKCDWEFLTVQCLQLIISNLKRHWHLLSREKEKNVVGRVGRGGWKLNQFEFSSVLQSQ